MLIVPQPSTTPDPDTEHFWAWYGATQLAERFGVGEKGGVVLDWHRNELRWSDEHPPAEDPSPAPASLMLRRAHSLTASSFTTQWPLPQDIPLLGGLSEDVRGTGALQASVEGVGRVALVKTASEGRSIRFAWPIFAEVGLLLSRFAWKQCWNRPGFVRGADDLWNDGLARRYGMRRLVDEFMALLLAAAQSVAAAASAQLLVLDPWPVDAEGAPYDFALACSHDVDAVYAAPEWRGRPWQAQQDNPWFNFQRWMDLETELSIRSAFYFETPAGPGAPEAGYDLADAPVCAAARMLAERGWEIGPHILSADDATIGAEVARFRRLTGRKPAGTRSHRLCHRWNTLDSKCAAGLIYDSTWYAEETASQFLCGTAFPFRPASTQHCAPLDMVELSNVVEDGIVFGVYGDGPARDENSAVTQGAAAVRQSASAGGYVVLNWHQRGFELMDRYPGSPAAWTGAYARLVREALAARPRVWRALPSEIARWWLVRSKVRLAWQSGLVAVTNEGDSEWTGAVVMSSSLHPYGRTHGAAPRPHPRRWTVSLSAGESRTIELM